MHETQNKTPTYNGELKISLGRVFVKHNKNV